MVTGKRLWIVQSFGFYIAVVVPENHDVTALAVAHARVEYQRGRVWHIRGAQHRIGRMPPDRRRREPPACTISRFTGSYAMEPQMRFGGRPALISVQTRPRRNAACGPIERRRSNRHRFRPARSRTRQRSGVCATGRRCRVADPCRPGYGMARKEHKHPTPNIQRPTTLVGWMACWILDIQSPRQT
jgi:hypothetical protein